MFYDMDMLSCNFKCITLLADKYVFVHFSAVGFSCSIVFFLISIVFFSWSKLAEVYKTFHSKRVTIIMSWRVNKSTTKLKRTKYKTHIHHFPSNNAKNRKIPTRETKQNVKQTKCTTWNLLWGNLSLFQREIICFISRTLCTCECLTYFQWACIVRYRFLVYYYRVLCIRLESTILWMQHMHFGIPYLVQQFIVVVEISCGCVMSLWFFFLCSFNFLFCLCFFPLFFFFFFYMHQHTNSVQNPKDSRSVFLFLLAFEATKIL